MFSRRNVRSLVIILACVIFFLPACGSDNKPGAAVGGKKDQAGAKTKKPQMQSSMVMEEGGPGAAKPAQKAPDSRRIEVISGMTQAELDAKAAESLAEMKKAEKTRGPILGGLTQEELEAKAAESQKQLELKGGGEIFPGMTRKEMEGIAAQGQMSQKTRLQEIFPGLTQAQIDASANPRYPTPEELFAPSGGK